jgi:hypothetical protein
VEGLTDASHLYEVERRARYAERPGFRITELQIGPASRSPGPITATCRTPSTASRAFCVSSCASPREELRLGPGETYTVRARRPHLVTNSGDTSAVFLVLQGIGEYDYVPLTRAGVSG